MWWLRWYNSTLVALNGKSACTAGDPGVLSLELEKILGGDNGNPHSSILENSMVERSLVGYSPCGCKVGHG